MEKLNLIIVMGVSGSGKSTLAEYIAKKLGYQYLDADNFHSEQAKSLMAQSIPLTDDIRQPWIERIITKLKKCYQSNNSVVLAYSGLKAHHRVQFRTLDFNVHFVMLEADEVLLTERLNARQGHYAKVGLLSDQINSMEKPTIDEQDIIVIPANQPLESLYHRCHQVIC